MKKTMQQHVPFLLAKFMQLIIIMNLT